MNGWEMSSRGMQSVDESLQRGCTRKWKISAIIYMRVQAGR
jgi:hypothetical protein